MTQPGNLYSSNDATNSNAEDVGDYITNVDPWETPVYSNMDTTKATNKKHEFLLDVLAAPSNTNYVAEGSDFAAEAQTAPTRKYNTTQIFTKQIAVSGTQEVVKKYGRTSESAYLKAKATKEVKNDIETMIFDNNAQVDSAEATAREMAGLPAWYTTNVSRGAGGSSGGSGTSAATNGTQRAYTESLLLTVCESIWTNSGMSEKTLLVANAYNVGRVMPTFTGNATLTLDTKEGKRYGQIDFYRTQFGTLKVVPCRNVAARDVHIIQPDYLRWATIPGRGWKFEEMAKTGDHERWMGLTEATLEVRNEAAMGIIADLTTS